ncbi:TlpA family protein disulfide reductase [Taibaiella chishuiensis]|uniref:Thiol-disulfide isomerase/thioredoxin n=1 Tax=Taibaiella chishuiensis TaxID=1434707 RepID=A0A2P8D0R2_9BACT|nr:thioredoxin family protein [Taibaiella chishuiensis]PSK90805.1 thiol-disulfide isomerase/thioredoxin [Taibaiella chishuiensis]
MNNILSALASVSLCFALLFTSSISKSGTKSKAISIAKAGTVIINLEYSQYQPGDTLMIRKIDLMNTTDHKNYYPVKDLNGMFRFEFPAVEKCGYWELIEINRNFDKRGQFIEQALSMSYFWETGDSITYYLSKTRLAPFAFAMAQFIGRGAFKYNVSRAINDLSIVNGLPQKKRLNPWFNDRFEFIRQTDTLLQMKLDLLLSLKPGLSSLSYEVLKADAIYSNDSPEYFTRKYFDDYVSKLPKSNREKLVANYFRTFGNVSLSAISIDGIENSAYSASYLRKKLSTSAYLLSGKEDQVGTYNQIKQNTGGYIRERILSGYFLGSRLVENIDSLIVDAKNLFVSNSGKIIYEKKILPMTFKKKFKNYELVNREGSTVTLNKFLGKIQVLDFWFSGCGGCMLYYTTALSKAEEHFKNDPEVEFISITSDRNADIWEQAIKSKKYTNERVTNLSTKGSEHAIYKENNIHSTPTALLLDKDGTVVFNNTSNLYNVDGLIKAIAELKSKKR